MVPFSLLMACFSLASASPAASEVRVSLFGQECWLRGPGPQEVLQAVHDVSPGKVPPVQNAEEGRLKLKSLPSRDLLPESMREYYDALAAYLKNPQKKSSYPEEEFHRALKTAKIHYYCHFEEDSE